jgi:hypothetical protein
MTTTLSTTDVSFPARRERLRAAPPPGFGRWCGRSFHVDCIVCEAVFALEHEPTECPWTCGSCARAQERVDALTALRRDAYAALVVVLTSCLRAELNGYLVIAAEALRDLGDSSGEISLTLRRWTQDAREAVRVAETHDDVCFWSPLADVFDRATRAVAKYARAMRREADIDAARRAA